MGVKPIDDLSVYGSVLYGKSEMDSDTTAASGAIVSTKGNDTPDFPKFMLKGGLSYRLYGLEIAPMARYISSRYGTVNNTEKVSPCMSVSSMHSKTGWAAARPIFLGHRSPWPAPSGSSSEPPFLT